MSLLRDGRKQQQQHLNTGPQDQMVGDKSQQQQQHQRAPAPAKKGVGKPKRGQANRRERVRTENVNAGFDNLRKLIPTDPVDRKLSKIEVLRLATSYINHLYNLTKANSCLEAEANEATSSSSSSAEDEDDDETANDTYHEDGITTVITTMDTASTTNHNDNDMLTGGKNRTQQLGNNQFHICTFCLMMTKATQPLESTKRK